MRPLTPVQLVQLWDAGRPLDPVSRALTLLAAALPSQSIKELAALSLGERDGLLLEVREHLFGPRLEAQAACPQCGERLTYELDTTQLRAMGVPPAPAYDLTVGDVALQARRLTSADLLATAVFANLDLARRDLAHRAVISASQQGEPLGVDALEEPALAALSAKLAEADPLAEVLLAMTCPACEQTWQESFDIAGHLWAEVEGEARRLLWAVHRLASAYGWSEEAILALTDARRQFYLELVES